METEHKSLKSISAQIMNQCGYSVLKTNNMIRYENNLRIDQDYRTRCNYYDFFIAQSYMELKCHKEQQKARRQVVHQEKHKLLSAIMKVHRPSIEDIFRLKSSWYEKEIR